MKIDIDLMGLNPPFDISVTTAGRAAVAEEIASFNREVDSRLSAGQMSKEVARSLVEREFELLYSVANQLSHLKQLQAEAITLARRESDRASKSLEKKLLRQGFGEKLNEIIRLHPSVSAREQYRQTVSDYKEVVTLADRVQQTILELANVVRR